MASLLLGLLPVGLQTHLMLTATRPVSNLVFDFSGLHTSLIYSLPLGLCATWFAACRPANTPNAHVSSIYTLRRMLKQRKNALFLISFRNHVIRNPLSRNPRNHY